MAKGSLRKIVGSEMVRSPKLQMTDELVAEIFMEAAGLQGKSGRRGNMLNVADVPARDVFANESQRDER
jgi:hypothetical protein